MSDLFVDQDDIARAVEGIANPRDSLVGEGKKFKTDEDLARGKLYSDLYIEKQKIELANEKARIAQLEAELENMRNTGKSALDVINRGADNQRDDNGNTQKMFTQEDVKQLVKETLDNERVVNQRKGNVELVQSELQKTWGNDAMKKLEEAASLFGGKEEVQRMAETNPKALLKLIGTKEPQAQTETRAPALFTPPTSTVRPPNSMTPSGELKGANYYNKMRRENPTQYWSGEAMNERLNQMIALGDNYYKH